MKKKITPEMLEQILAAYSAGEKTSVIAKTFDLDSSYVSRIANSHGLRRTIHYHKKANKADSHTCRSCGKQNPTEARFCMFCGKDVRSEKTIVIESIEHLRQLVTCLPAHMQKEADEITRQVLKYLREVKTNG